jgi:MtN3 and saliva related transmembrane protein
MNLINIIGILAAFCTTFAFVPQVIQILKTRDTKGISLGMYIIFVLGIAFWLAYGIFLQDVPLITANTVTLLLAGTVLAFKIKNG